jgi:hypothetical protein
MANIIDLEELLAMVNNAVVQSSNYTSISTTGVPVFYDTDHTGEVSWTEEVIFA